MSEMVVGEYNNESELQTLLADHPELLSGCFDDEGRWLLVSQEFGVPDEMDGANRWSLDHLFVNSKSVPIFVEVKRSNDPRIRREVVGQLLEYAANATSFVPIERLVQKFDETCQRYNMDSSTALAEVIGEDKDPDEFWANVRTNMQAGKIRLLFVADELPSELQRIIEFLNEQMSELEVLGIELKKFAEADSTAYVPLVVGKTQSAVNRKRPAYAAQESPQILLDAVSTLEKRGIHFTGRKPRYRQYSPDDFPPGLHYELLMTRDVLVAEFHIENGKYRSLGQTLQQLVAAHPQVGQFRLTYDPNWSKQRGGRLRLLPDSQQRLDGEQTGEHMVQLISVTSGPILAALAAME